MKNLILSFVSILIMGVFVSSCSKSEDELQVPESNEKLDFADFEKLGVIHNRFMTNFKDNFRIDPTIDSRSVAIESVNQFNLAFADKITDIPEGEKQLFKTLLEENKRFVDSQAFYKEAFVSSNALRSGGEDSQGLLLDCLKEAFANDMIDQFEYEKLKLIGLKTKENYEGSVLDAELEKLIISIKDEWVSKKYTENSKHGRALAYTLAISLASIEWWKENPDAASSGLRATTVLPVFVGRDIAGAIIGGVSSGVGSYATGGSVNWKSVGWGAGAGAVLGSIGAVAQLGGWISKLF
jgi:hypothetical protein